MSLYKRGEVWHYDFTFQGVRYRGSTGLRSKADANRKLEVIRRGAALGELGRAIPTLEQASALWFRSRIAGKKSEKTVAQRLEIMLALVGPTNPVTQIGSREIEEAIQTRRLQVTRQGRPPTNSTVNRDIVDTT